MKNLKRKIREGAKKMLASFLMLTMVVWTLGASLMVSVPAAKASVTGVTVSQMVQASQTIKASSVAVPITKVAIVNDGSAATLSSIKVTFSGTGFATTDLATLATGDTSGVALYGGTVDTPGAPVTLVGDPSWSGNAFTMTPSSAPTLTISDTTYFYVMIKTSSSITNGDQIVANIGTGDISVSVGTSTITAFTSGALTADTTAPTIAAVQLVNPSAVEVTFSEAMDSTTAQTSGYYTFSDVNVIDVVQQSSNVFRVVADGAITAGEGGTTLTVSANVTDSASNPNATTGAQAITESVEVKISEVQTSGTTVKDEFIELYNAGGSAVNLANWDIKRKTSGGTEENVSLDITGSIPAYGFFLIAPRANCGDGNNESCYTGGVVADDEYTTDNWLASDDNTVLLYNASDTLIDKVGWGDGANVDSEGTEAITVPMSANQSLERKAFGDSQAVDLATNGMDVGMGNGWDTGDNSFDFVVQASPNPQNSSSTVEQPDLTDYDGAAGGGPMIMHMPINSAVTGADLEITAQMGDPMTPIDNIVAELHYMVGDEDSTDGTFSFTTILGIHQSNGFFKFTVPSATMTAVDSAGCGLFYYLKVVTDGGTAFMSASPSVDTGTYATIADQEAAVAINPFITTIVSGTLYAISGTVSNGSGGLNGVLVMIEGTGYSATTATDGTAGKYSISVPNGIYNITMVKDGYYEEWINDIFVYGANVTGVDRTMFAGTGGGMTGDSEKPMVMWSGPPDGMMGIPSGMADFKIFIGLSKALDSSTFNTTSVTLTNNPSGAAEAALTGYTAEYNPTRTAAMPPENMDPYLGVISLPAGGGGFTENTTYYLIMDGTIRDTAGNALQGNRPDGGHMISFTTGLASGSLNFNNFGTGAMMPPFVVGTNPYDGAMNVMTNAKININFSDPMNSASVTTADNIKLYRITYDGYSEIKTPVSLSSVSLDTSGENATLTPGSALTAGGKYRVVVSGALTSATGIWMGDPGATPPQNVASYEFYSSEFEVGTGLDSTKPTVLGSWPANGNEDIPVNPGMMTIQFSEGMDPSTINSNTITLKRGTSAVTGNISYDSMSQSASFSPSVVLATSTDYTLTVTTGVTDAVGNAIVADNVIIFTTNSNGDTGDPSIMFANGDEYGVAITFSESMNSANVADTANYGTSVLNPANYIIKQGPAGTTSWGGISALVLTDAQFKYDGMGNTVMIDDIPGTTINNDYYIDTTSSIVTGAGVTDLSGNDMTSDSTFQMPIQSSANTQGMLGPMMMGGGMMGPDMGVMGMMGASVFPMNGMAGQTTTYFVDVPTTKVIPVGGRIVLTFPVGFDVTNAAKDTYSPVNNDINEWNAGTVTFGIAEESPQSGGANEDGVTVNISTRTITITTAGSATQASDFLCMDIKGIVNSSIPRGFETSGYTVDMKTMDNDGNLLETITAMPFFINAGGSNSLEVTIDGVTSGHNGDVTVFLGSPMTGPMEQTVAFTAETEKTVTFSNLLAGQYMLFTEPTITLGVTDYSGMPMPQPITISGANTKTISLAKEEAGAGKAAITVSITGIPLNDEIDVFAGSPTGFKVKTLTGTGVGDTLSATLYLTDGDWMVGMGPAMPKGPMAGPPPMPDWMPPMPINIVVSGTGGTILENSNNASITGGSTIDGAITFTISTATMMEIVGYVQDGDGTAIADAEVFAYQPMGMGMGSHTKTDTNGKFTLKVATAGTYSVGVFKPGLPGVPDRTVKVAANVDSADGNSTAEITADGALITAANQFIFKIQKPDWTISGKVTNGTNPVSYAPVWAYQPNGMGHAETMTDASGNYILYVANGNWIVQSYIPGYGDSEAKTVVVNSASMTQNLSQDSSVTYYTIGGTVTLNDNDQTYMPIRAVEYDSNGNYLGREYGGQTNADGEYSISVPGSADGRYYRVDIWTPEFGEVELTVTDEVTSNPANVIITTASKAGKDIIIASADLNTIILAFTNGGVSQTAIINIDGVSGTPPKPTGFHKTIKLSTLGSSSSVELPDGDYTFYIDVPGSGGFAPTGGNPVTVSENATVTFVLPDSSTVFTISGKITGPGNIEGAWVWMGNSTTGVQVGDMTDSNGDYSITVREGNYKMGVEMPGYAPQSPTSVTVSADETLNYILTATDQFITGRIYADTGSDGYTSGEEIASGWAWVEETTTKQIAGAPTALDGTFSIGVVDGTYILRGAAEGYSDTKFGVPITVSGSDSSGNNINLTADANWSIKIKSKPMTPASGGTIDDSLSSGTGIKVVAPPNALGSGTSAGTIKTKEVSSVAKTSSAEPLGGKGKEITAQNNSGQAITTLNSDIEIELNYYKEDITEAGLVNFDKLKTLTNSYWDVSINDWVPLSTTKKAFTKAVGAAANAEWTAQPDFDAFADVLTANSNAYDDYKIALQSTTSHLTIFGGTNTSDLIAPSAPTGLSQTSGLGTSVVLDWTDHPNTDGDLLEYEIYRSTSSGVTKIDANQVNVSQVTASTFTDSTTTAWTSYYYTITAADDARNESTVAAEVQMCSSKNTSVTGGTVNAQTCLLTALDGYTCSDSTHTCTAVSTGGSSVGSSAPSSATGQVAATPSMGGTASKANSDGTSAKVVFPANALSEKATITVVSKNQASITVSRPVPSGKSVVGNYVYNFTAVSGTTAVTSFNKTITITLKYTNNQIAGLNEGALKIHYWNDTSGGWVSLEDNAVDPTNNTVTATTTHFTYFAILGVQADDITTTQEIIDGDIIQCETSDNPFAVYIVKIVGDTSYIRHIVSLEIFNYYGHLEWDNLKQVDSLSGYSLSGWARVNTGPNGTPGPTDKVYEINGDQSKHWINMTADQFLTHGGSDAAIYIVNQGELDLYTTGPDVMSL